MGWCLCAGGARGDEEQEDEGFGEGFEGSEVREGDLVLNGTLRSGNCGLLLRLGGASTHLAEHYAKALRYTACMTALTLLQAREEALLLLFCWEAPEAPASMGFLPGRMLRIA
jgi:hypothetical protein